MRNQVIFQIATNMLQGSTNYILRDFSKFLHMRTSTSLLDVFKAVRTMQVTSHLCITHKLFFAYWPRCGFYYCICYSFSGKLLCNIIFLLAPCTMFWQYIIFYCQIYTYETRVDEIRPKNLEQSGAIYLKIFLKPIGVSVKKETLVFDALDMVGNIGGYLGLLLGWSLLSLFSVFQKKVNSAINYVRNKYLST